IRSTTLPMPNLSYISPKAIVQESPIHGRGLFAIAPIAQGEIVCIKGGYILTRAVLNTMPEWYGGADIPIADNLYIGPLRQEEREGSMIFSNHSCEPNIGVQGQIVFVAMRDIAAGEELTHDWATTDDEDYRMECRCQRPTCRGTVTGRDWMKPDLQARYRGWFCWFLERKIEALSSVRDRRA